MKIKLNLGSGNDLREGYINVDLYVPDKIPKGINFKQLDLNRVEWLWEDNSIDYIHARMILEHVGDPFNFMRECYKIMKKGSEICIEVPYHNSNGAFSLFHKTFYNHNWYNKFVYAHNIQTGKKRVGIQSEHFNLFKLKSVEYIPTIRAKKIPGFIRKFIAPMIGEVIKSTKVVLIK